LRLTGKVLMDDVPADATGGAAVRFTVRSRLGEAWFASADPRVRVKGATIKDYLLQLYRPLGFGEADFVFDQDAVRDVMRIGKSICEKWLGGTR
jgi:hypothetical protein